VKSNTHVPPLVANPKETSWEEVATEQARFDKSGPNASTARKLCDWLNGLGPDRVRDAQPVTVSITYKGKTETFYAARYTWVGQYTASMTCVQDGRYKTGEEYTTQVFYVLGLEPRTAKLKIKVAGFWEHRIVYNLPDDDSDWYLSGWFVPTRENVQHHEFHPFGAYWSLGRWPHESIGRIDQYDSSRTRLPIVVKPI